MKSFKIKNFNFKDKLSHLSSRQALILSAIAGLAVFAFIYVYMTNMSLEGKRHATSDLVQVVAAATEIKDHEKITSNELKIISVPRDAVPAGAIKSTSDAIGRIAQSTIYSGDVITDSKLFADEKAAGFVGMIPPNCRAVTLAVNEVTGVGGFLKPGEYVDVTVVSNKSQSGTSGRLLMQDIKILAVNSNDKENAKKGTTQMSNITLAVEAKDVLPLITAAQSGVIYLSLRPMHPKDPFLLMTNYSLSKGASPDTPTDDAQADEKAPSPAAANVSAPPPAVRAVPQQPMPQPAAPAARPAKSSEGSVSVYQGTQESVVSL